MDDDGREQFEAMMRSEPFARQIDRWPDDPENHAWPGCYVDIDTDLAWQVWKEAWRESRKTNREQTLDS
jgi:hypothetical protein